MGFPLEKHRGHAQTPAPPYEEREGGATRGCDLDSKVFGPIKAARCRVTRETKARSIMVCTDGCPRGFAQRQHHYEHTLEFLSASDRDLMDPRIRAHRPEVLWDSVAAYVRI